MKIVKRDGRTVEYNSEKIRIAIGKANNEVGELDKIKIEEIESIISYIESLGKKRMLVEDIQDIIEEKLMELGKFSLAKKYIIYRYTRSIIRKSNTTDASILSLLKNEEVSSGNYLVANRQRDVMAGEASKDLAYRLLLPRNVVEAEKGKAIKFCNVEYFTEPIIESLKIDLNEILDNGTVLNGVKVERPKGFQSACNIFVEIIASIASSQTGEIYVNFSDLFKYYYSSYDKNYKNYKSILNKNVSQEEINAIARTQTFLEIISGIQTLFYQINTITLANGLVPKVCFLVDPRDCQNPIEEQIVLELLKQKSMGLKNENDETVGSEYPMIIYCYNQDKQYEYLNEEVLHCPYMSFIMGEEKFLEFSKNIAKFNQGSIIINLLQIALNVQRDKLNFLEELEKTLGYCYEGMLCRNHNLQGVYSDKSPIHWRYGAVTKLEKGVKIDSLLKKEHSYLNLVVVGFEAALKILGEDIKKDIVASIEGCVKTWNQCSSFEVRLSNYYNPCIISKLIASNEGVQINNVFDSYEFMNDNYFKKGFFYLVDMEKDKDINDLIGENKFIIAKKK